MLVYWRDLFIDCTIVLNGILEIKEVSFQCMKLIQQSQKKTL